MPFRTDPWNLISSGGQFGILKVIFSLNCKSCKNTKISKLTIKKNPNAVQGDLISLSWNTRKIPGEVFTIKMLMNLGTGEDDEAIGRGEVRGQEP